MAYKALALVVGLIVGTSPVVASEPNAPAPPGSPTTKYCLRVTVTGNVSDRIECWTRDEWAEQDVDVDREWATNGVRTIDA